MIKLFSAIKLLYLSIRQDSIIFIPKGFSIKQIKAPEKYGLEEVSEVTLCTEDNINIEIWTKSPKDKSLPTFLLFHGNTGNWGDVGQTDRCGNYDRNYRIKLLKTIEQKGFGFIAVSLRGYGKSDGKPSEKGFAKDVNAIADYIEKMNFNNIVVIGESLGASVAFMMAEEMSIRKEPPALIASIAAFSSLENKVLELHPDLTTDNIRKKLHHHFYIKKNLENISNSIPLYIAHPELDKTTHKHHGEDIAKFARELDFSVTHKELKGAGHITWNPDEVIGDIVFLL